MMSDRKRKHYTLPGSFITESGQLLEQPTIAWQSWGELSPSRDNVILVCHALTGHADASEWWSGLFGSGQLLDPDRYLILSANVLGSCYGSTGPISPNPQSNRPYLGDFPHFSIRDMIRLQQHLIDHLDIRRIQTVVGGSMGGMQALEWYIMEPRVESAVVIATGAHHSPWAIGFNHAQRRAITSSHDWNQGQYDPSDPPGSGLAVARQLAMLSYRSPRDYASKFGRRFQPEQLHQFEVESYLDYQGRKLVQRFDPWSYIRLTQAMDSHDILRGRDSGRIRRIPKPLQIIGIQSDQLYPPEEQEALANLFDHARLDLIDSPHGHDAFLIEFDQLESIIRPFLENHTTPKISI
ncbi:MAG: homoserine O-acetyltransferase MetX [Bacteroidota bacterium]